MLTIAGRSKRRRIFLHDRVEVRQFGDLLLDLSLVIVVVGQRIMDLSRLEMGKLEQDFLNR
jgi:hypothetical protein